MRGRLAFVKHCNHKSQSSRAPGKTEYLKTPGTHDAAGRILPLGHTQSLCIPLPIITENAKLLKTHSDVRRLN